MKLITFTYTKANGEVSERTLLACVQPGNKFAGIDLSDISPEDASSFSYAYQALHDDFLLKLDALKEKYDLKHNYRQFIEGRMSNVTEI